MVALEVEISQAVEGAEGARDAVVIERIIAERETPDALVVLANFCAEELDVVVQDPLDAFSAEIECLAAVLAVLESLLDKP